MQRAASECIIFFGSMKESKVLQGMERPGNTLHHRNTYECRTLAIKTYGRKVASRNVRHGNIWARKDNQIDTCKKAYKNAGAFTGNMCRNAKEYPGMQRWNAKKHMRIHKVT